LTEEEVAAAVNKLKDLVAEEMTGVLDLKVRLKVHLGIGYN
jgi:hypothetical protein